MRWATRDRMAASRKSLEAWRRVPGQRGPQFTGKRQGKIGFVIGGWLRRSVTPSVLASQPGGLARPADAARDAGNPHGPGIAAIGIDHQRRVELAGPEPSAERPGARLAVVQQQFVHQRVAGQQRTRISAG